MAVFIREPTLRLRSANDGIRRTHLASPLDVVGHSKHRPRATTHVRKGGGFAEPPRLSRRATETDGPAACRVLRPPPPPPPRLEVLRAKLEKRLAAQLTDELASGGLLASLI